MWLIEWLIECEWVSEWVSEWLSWKMSVRVYWHLTYCRPLAVIWLRSVIWYIYNIYEIPQSNIFFITLFSYNNSSNFNPRSHMWHLLPSLVWWQQTDRWTFIWYSRQMWHTENVLFVSRTQVFEICMRSGNCLNQNNYIF